MHYRLCRVLASRAFNCKNWTPGKPLILLCRPKLRFILYKVSPIDVPFLDRSRFLYSSPISCATRSRSCLANYRTPAWSPGLVSGATVIHRSGWWWRGRSAVVRTTAPYPALVVTAAVDAWSARDEIEEIEGTCESQGSGEEEERGGEWVPHCDEVVLWNLMGEAEIWFFYQ